MRTPPVVSSLLATLATLAMATRVSLARADEHGLAEPVLEENITDIDSEETSSLEVDVTGGAFRSTPKRAGYWHSAIEAELRPFARAGIGGELDAGGPVDGSERVHLAPRLALSYVLLQDFARQLFVQAEVGVRYEDDRLAAPLDPTEAGQPAWAGLREALKLGPIELRAGLFAQAFGRAAHLPLRASGGLFYAIIGGSARGAVGAEVLVDGSRDAPALLAPEAQLLTRVAGAPLRFALAVPFTLRAKDESTYGLALRIVLEPSD